MSITPRPYQMEAVHSVFDAWDEGCTRLLVTQPTGTGKTLTSAELIRLLLEYFPHYKVLFMVHRREIVMQTYQAFGRYLPIPSWELGIELAENRADATARVVVASVQTIINSKRLPNWKPDVIICDECFPAGTKVDGKPIESLRVGDVVRSHNHRAGTMEYRKVLTLYRNPVKSLLRITLETGKQIVCTPEHPIYNGKEYIPACKLTAASIVAGIFGNSLLAGVAVERVESLEPGSDGTFGGLCPDGHVYNIEVQGNNNYFVDDVLVHNCQHSASPSYRAIFDRYGVSEGTCLLIGFTATARRGDRTALYAYQPDGSALRVLDKKTKKEVPVDPALTVFERHCYEYSAVEAMEAGWLLVPRGVTVETGFDLTGVGTKKDKNGEDDFIESQLIAALEAQTDEALKRSIIGINAWEKIAKDRPTVAFCASVEHAKHTAQLWCQAGYRFKAVWGEMDAWERYIAFKDLKEGRIHGLTNYGVITEGVDLPSVSCIVIFRPTQIWSLYVQMVGRALRPDAAIADALTHCATDDDRLEMIANSLQPDALVIDLVDNYKTHKVCTLPVLLDLPPQIRMSGESLGDLQRLTEPFRKEDVIHDIIEDCPISYEDLEIRLREVNVLHQSGARSTKDWTVSRDGFRFRRCAPGYKAEMVPVGNGQYRLYVQSAAHGVVYDKTTKPDSVHDFKGHLDAAASAVRKEIDRDRQQRPMVSRGTLDRLTPGQIKVLTWGCGRTREEIDCMPYLKAKGIITKHFRLRNAQKAQEEMAL